MNMKLTSMLISAVLALVLSNLTSTSPTHAAEAENTSTEFPTPLDMKKANKEIETHYAKAHPEFQEYVRMTARTFGRNGMWLNQDAFAALPKEEREKKIKYLAVLLNDGEYGRHLCKGLAEAGSLKDKRLVPGLLKVAGYHLEDRDYDCRPKWMAVAALARQESDDAIPLLVFLVDHGNQNTRMWASAALSRKTGQDFRKDKRAWAEWWQAQGHQPIEKRYLQPWTSPLKTESR
jgi:hypothetical protein